MLVSLLLALTAQAVPADFHHQGRVFDSAGLPLDGAQDVTARLLDAPGGAELWTETQVGVVFDNGYFAMELSSIPDAALDGDLHLELDISGSVLPPIRVVSVPFAMRANHADTAATADTALSADVATDVSGGVVDATEIQINGTTVIDSSGNLAAGAGDGDTLAALGCGAGDIALFDGLDWQCAPSLAAHTHNAAEIDSGVLDIGRLPVGSSAADVAPGDHIHGFGQITGQIAVGQMPVGTGASEVAAGNHTHAPSDAATLDGLDSTDFAGSGHGHGAPAWGALTGKPAVLADDQVGWAEVQGIPGGFADGTDDGLTAEADPSVNALGKATLSCSTDQIARFDGTNWVCANDTRPQVLFQSFSGGVAAGTNYWAASQIDFVGPAVVSVDASALVRTTVVGAAVYMVLAVDTACQSLCGTPAQSSGCGGYRNPPGTYVNWSDATSTGVFTVGAGNHSVGVCMYRDGANGTVNNGGVKATIFPQ